jgi:ribosomal protein S18 acetylase RimI-like enzyme
MTITIRPYEESDWDAISRIHDAARMDELAASVGVDAFLDLATTYESEGLFDGDVWVGELDGEVAGFIAVSDDEVTWTYVHPSHYRATAPLELEVLDGNTAARQLYESEGFELQRTRTGKLVGNEAFTATGHTLVYTPPSA